MEGRYFGARGEGKKGDVMRKNGRTTFWAGRL